MPRPHAADLQGLPPAKPWVPWNPLFDLSHTDGGMEIAQEGSEHILFPCIMEMLQG